MGWKITLFEILGRLSLLIISGGIYEVLIRSTNKITYNTFSVVSLIICYILGLIWSQLPLIKKLNSESGAKE